MQNLSHFFFELSLTKTVQPAAQMLASAVANGPVFGCLKIAERILAPAKDSTLFWCTKIEHKLAR
jgi:hypothetical protein